MILHPDSDDTIGPYTDQAAGTTNIYTTIDESSPSDADYITSTPNPANETYICTLSNPAATIGPGNWSFQVRYRMLNWVNDAGAIDFNLRDSAGVVSIKQIPIGTPSTSFVTVSATLSASDIANITDNNALIVRINANFTGGDDGAQLQVSYVALVIPDAGTANPIDGCFGGPFASACGG